MGRGAPRRGAAAGDLVQVIEFATPMRPDWRWRIVGYSGEMLEESHFSFPTIGAAVADGTRRLVEMNTEFRRR